MNIGQRITDIRERLQLNQKELAEKTGLNESVMNRIEKGTRAVRDDEIIKIAQVLGVTTDFLLTGNNKKNDIGEIEIYMQQRDNNISEVIDGYKKLDQEEKETILNLIRSLKKSKASKK